MTTSGRVAGRRWLWLSAGVLVVVLGVAAAMWMMHGTRGNTAHDDCTVVEQLGHQWIAMKQSVTALQNGSGEAKDLIAIADNESAMSDKIRTAEAAVSAPALKDELDQWAQGTALSAKNQRDAVSEPPPQVGQPPQPGADADTVRAGTMIYNATAALHKACPNMGVA